MVYRTSSTVQKWYLRGSILPVYRGYNILPASSGSITILWRLINTCRVVAIAIVVQLVVLITNYSESTARERLRHGFRETYRISTVVLRRI